MIESISKKITFLNQTTLESLDEENDLAVIKSFTDTALNILEADFGFAWWKSQENTNYYLAYKSKNTPYEPNIPRERGGNFEAQKSQQPFFVTEVKKGDYEEAYDVSPYMQSYVIIPVAYKGTIYGNLVICYEQQKDFSDEEKSLCVALGNSAAQAITINRLVKSEHEARVAAENQEARFRTLIENSYDGILLVDENGKILDASYSVKKVTGYDAKSLLKRNIFEFINPDNLADIQAQIKKTLENPDTANKIEFSFRHEDGGWRWMEAIGMNMLSNATIGAIVINIRDVTERREAENFIKHQALHDTLTDLPNREEFSARLNQSLDIAKRNKGQVAVMFLDIDRFKNINDALGHNAGDTVLKVAAARFSSCLRSEDTVARFGGDEFLILINEVNSPKDAAVVAEKILKAMRVPIKVGEHTLHLSVSIGVAIYPADGLDKEGLKKNADVALYQAKKNGRNRCQIYENSMEVYASEKFVLENELRQAFEYEQIVLYYQPIINLKTGELVALEALSRWQHPDKGLLLPSEFIPFAEEICLISMLDEYVIRKACFQIKQWQNLKLPSFRVAINLSAQEFSEPNFVSNIVGILAEHDVDPENLEIEITESLAMSNLELTGANLKALKKLGFKISIDDFGTGYSSLSYLKRFPINSLKIDRSFIRGCITNSQDTSITRTIISMAHNLNLKAVAEGVETQQHLEFLQSLGCDSAQGFYISQPLSPEKLPAWIEEFKLKKN